MCAMDVDRRRQLLVEATQRLLGDTMELTDDQWHSPSTLPGWTRAHVATHLARNADGMAGVVRGLLAGETVHMYPSREARNDAIAAGADREALELQVDLDSSATRLEEAFDEVEDWSVPVEMHPGKPLDHVEQMIGHRMVEVVIHHIDLDCGVGFDDIDPEVAHVALERFVGKFRDRDDAPALRLEPSDGEVLMTSDESPVPVSGSSAALLGWISGRTDASTVTGATGVDLPAT